MVQFFGLVLATTLVLCTAPYKIYQGRIPNGDAVPHPCKPNNIWEGVAHFIDEGTGYRNPFGLDFEKEGKSWTEALCRKDSDGDGMTNGQELGDPACVWKENAIPARMTNLSHPGICDPWDSEFCRTKNVTSPKYQTQMDWMTDMCKSKEFVCKGLNETDVHSVNVTLNPGTKVPAKPTTYVCQVFDFEKLAPKDDYHVIAVEPILDNKYVIHHIVLYGCSDDQLPTLEPYECGMGASQGCSHVISIWTVGLSGDCFHPSTGITIGNLGSKRIAIQLHWNNPDSRADWVDSSGMKIYFTTKKRQYEANFLVTGHEWFILPPLQPSTVVRSTCSSECTKTMFVKPIWVTLAWNHMHYAGVQVSVQVIRNKTSSFFISNDLTYSYDSPQVHSFTDDPVQLLPGDELVTTCTFNTARRTKSTLWGDATLDEMCYGLLIYYPKENAPNVDCKSMGPDVLRCDKSTYHDCPALFNYSTPEWLNSTQMYADVHANCKRYGPCLQECLQTISRLRREDPCLRDEIFDFIKFEMWPNTTVGQELLSLFTSCDVEVYKGAAMNATQVTTDKPSSDDTNENNSCSLVYTSVIFVVISLVLSLLI